MKTFLKLQQRAPVRKKSAVLLTLCCVGGLSVAYFAAMVAHNHPSSRSVAVQQVEELAEVRNRTSAVKTSPSMLGIPQDVEFHHPSSRAVAVQQVKQQGVLGNPEDVDFNAQHNLTVGTRLCHIDNPRVPIVNQPKPSLKDSMLKGMGQMDALFQCGGPTYFEYALERLLPMIQRRQRDSPHYGTRQSLVPPASKSKSILVIGNSHIRQTIVTLACQYRDQFRFHEQMLPELLHRGMLSPRLTFEVGDKANLTIAILTNPPLAYSPRWKLNLEQVLGHPLDELDAILVGKINSYNSTLYHDAVLWETTRSYGNNHSDWQVDLDQHPLGMPIGELVQHYSGPIVRVSMFAKSDVATFESDKAFFANLKFQSGRSNLHTIDARQHLEEPEFGRSKSSGEQCSSPPHTLHAQDCVPSYDIEYAQGHPCMGSKGGAPDLVAFDIVEKLWQIFV